MLDIVILAAGMGTRMKSTLPKVLHPVGGRPMVLEVLETARALEPAHCVVVVGHGAEQVQALVNTSRVSFALQTEQLGTGHAVLQAREALTESRADTVLVLYGDSPLITPASLHRALDSHRNDYAALSLLSFVPSDPTGYGRILRDSQGRVTGIVEHQDANDNQRLIRESNSGFMIFRAAWLWKVLPALPMSARGEYYLTDLVALAVKQNLKVCALVIDANEVLGVNDRVQLAQASAVLYQRRRDHWMRAGVTLVDPATTYIEAGVTIGRDTVIQPQVLLKGTTTIGPNCEIGPFVVLENAIVKEGAQVAPFTTVVK